MTKTCTMPGCSGIIEKGSRLCSKHASAGSDLRVPQYVLDLGLDGIYKAMENWSGIFSVEDIINKVDYDFVDCNEQEQANRTNAMAKLFRTLRANNFITKRGHYNGFVCYSKNAWAHGISVSVDEEPASDNKSTACNLKPITPAILASPPLYTHNHSLPPSLDEKRYLKLQQENEQLKTRLDIIEKRIENTELLWQKAKQLDDCMLKIMQELDVLKKNNLSSSMTEIRNNLHPLLRGKAK